MANRKRVREDVELIQIENWGVPNWKSPVDITGKTYSKPGYPNNWEKLTSDQKKWEFLRRTAEYRKDWDKAADIQNVLKPTSKFHSRFDTKRLISKYNLSEPISPKISYANLPAKFHFKKEDLGSGLNL